MAKVKCEFCGHYIDDSQEKCPTCGAPNKDHKRVVDGTPKTIEQLQSWYKARNLPPEDVTRFFIGKDTRAPRAFGIYEANGEFIVYKNKSDGSRAIRYKGTDEAYAVNELYMRLKEEILNQKNINLKNKSKIANDNRYRKKKKKSNVASLIVTTFIMFFFIIQVSILGLIYGIMGDTTSSFDYYLTENQDIYYYDGYNSKSNGYDWWKFDKSLNDWTLYSTYEDKETLPPGIKDGKKYDYVSDLADVVNIDYNLLNIYRSRAYIDAGNHLTPSTSYYYYDNNLYYFLNDSYSSYGDTDNSGWYIFNDDAWEYYCDEDDKEALGDDLWYSDGEYYVGRNIGDIYSYDDSLSTSWNPTSFEDTTWYQSYEENLSAYKEYQDSHQSSYDDDDYDWSSDSDWDWDSGDSWDSGGTDWDSDW